ncbi:MAG: sigma-70 family RNA polymerase sigma factor [Proteobacteria bacterium]|nr:sigma-70 family RNA polymerase sigma factor [Pseudomonadota bacterium]
MQAPPDAATLALVSEREAAKVRAGRGSAGVSAELLAACYDDVRRIARGIVARDGPNRPLQATELANEAAIRLMGLDRMEINGKAHMLAMAARTMRRIMIDEARKGAAGKRRMPTMVTRWPDDPAAALLDIGDLDRALEALGEVSPEHAQVVELRFMLGLTVEEAARASGLAERTIKRRWQAARAWLLERLGDDVAFT